MNTGDFDFKIFIITAAALSRCEATEGHVRLSGLTVYAHEHGSKWNSISIRH